MRSILLTILISLSVLFSLTGTIAHAANPKTVVLDVPGMTCKFCPITVRKSLKKVPGVIDAQSDYDSRTATVTYDEDVTNVKALTDATKDAGYVSTPKQ